MIDKEIDELYEEFKGLPSTNKIVRFNQKNDAFVLFVAKHVLEEKLFVLIKKMMLLFYLLQNMF